MSDKRQAGHQIERASLFMINANRRSYTLIHSLLLWKAPGARDNLGVLLAGGKDLNRERNAINQPERS